MKIIEGLTIRKATIDDLEALALLYRQLVTEDAHKADLLLMETIFRKISGYPDYGIYLAEQDGESVGTLALLVMDSLGHMGVPVAVLDDVVVVEKYRGRGIGQQMMMWATDLARNKGCEKIFFCSGLKRTAAHKFYEDLGFARHGYSYYLNLRERKS